MKYKNNNKNKRKHRYQERINKYIRLKKKLLKEDSKRKRRQCERRKRRQRKKLERKKKFPLISKKHYELFNCFTIDNFGYRIVYQECMRRYIQNKNNNDLRWVYRNFVARIPDNEIKNEYVRSFINKTQTYLYNNLPKDKQFW
jgi:hypothetical protein